MNIPFLSFNEMHASIKKEMMDAFEKFYDSGWYVLGENVKKFETGYSSLSGVKHTIGVSNGLDALHLCLKALNIGQGDEVIVPSNTYIASVLAVSFTGATPVFAEPYPQTYNLNPANFEAAITSRTKAVMPVHLYGQCCEMEKIVQIAQQNGLYVIEDNAQSQLSSYKNKMAGSWGDVNATSFYPGKNLGALGDAGAVTTNFDQYAEEIRVLRNYGSQKKYFNKVIGYNMRLDECQAALLQIKLNYVRKWTEERQTIASWYNETLKNVGDLILPEVASDATHVYHLYVVRTVERNAFQDYLNKNGIGTLIHYPVPPHMQEAYKYLNYKKGDFPLAEEIAETCISLPVWPGMTQTHVNKIADCAKAFFKQ